MVKKNGLDRKTLTLLLFSSTLTVMAGAIVSPVINDIRMVFDLSASRVGFVITTHGLFVALLSPLAGIVIDRFGPRWPYLIGLIFYALSGAAGLVVDSFVALIVSRALLGIAVAFFFNAVTVVIYNHFSGDSRNRMMGFRGTANSSGGIVWPLIGGFLGTFSWRLPFSIYLIAFGVAAGMFFWLPGEAHAEHHSSHRDEISFIGMLKIKPTILAIYGLVMLWAILLYTLIIFMPQKLAELGEKNSFFISLFIALSAVSAAGTSALYGWIKSRCSYRTVFALAILCWVVVFTGMALADSKLMIGLILPFFGIGQGLALPASMVYMAEGVPPKLRGRISSIQGTFGFLGQFLCPVLLAPVLAFGGFREVFGVAAAASALALVGSMIFWLFSRRGLQRNR